MTDNQAKVIIGTAVAVGAVTVAGLAYLYSKKAEPIPKKWRKIGKITELNWFPVKSCAPIKRDSLNCHTLGMEYANLFDRCFIVSQNNKQATARTFPDMVRIQPKLEGSHLTLSAPGQADLVLNLDELRTRPINQKVECWYAKVEGIDAGDEAANWLTEFLIDSRAKFRLIFYPHLYATKGVSPKDRKYKAYRNEDAGCYHDKTSYMLINQASIDELNTHLDHVVKPLQFRPNLVVDGQNAYDEDNWQWVKVGDSVIFRVLKPCTRCIFVNINPETAQRNPQRQPLETLVKTRTILPGETPVMGVQMGIRVQGSISIGDDVYINDESEA